MASEFTPFIDEMKKIRKEFKRKRREEMANKKHEDTDLLTAMENVQLQDKADSYRNASATLQPIEQQEGGLDIHSGYGFDFDTPEFEASWKAYMDAHPNTDHYPADHFDKLLAGELDDEQTRNKDNEEVLRDVHNKLNAKKLDGCAKDNPFVEPDFPEKLKIEATLYEITTVSKYNIDEDKD